MRRHLLSHLEGLDLDALEVAEAAARRAGITIEDWLAAALVEQGVKAEQPRRQAGDDIQDIIGRIMKSSDGAPEARPAAAPLERPARGEQSRGAQSPDEPSRTAIALESMASWIEHAEERLNENARVSADHQDRMAAALSQALSALKDRLDTVERSVASDRVPPARIEFPVQDAIKALSPLSETLSGLRTDMSRLAERLEQPAAASLAPAVAGVRADIERVKSSMENLATRDEIAALDHAIHRIGKDLEKGRSTKDILTLATSTAAIHRQVQTLSEDVAEGLHRSIGTEIERLRDRIDAIAKNGIDPAVIEFLGGQIVEMRQELARRAEPQQIERLSGEVGSLSRQIEELRSNQVSRSDFAALKSSLENVCAALSRTVASQEASTVPDQLQDLSRRIDVLTSRPEPQLANLDPIAGQLSLLTERMAAMTDTRFEQTDALSSMIERLSSQVQAVADNSLPREPLLKRFDQLEDELRQVGQQADTSNVELLLRSIGERLEQQPAPSASAFEALEKRIVALADQLAQSPAEPLREIFEGAATHLKTLQDESAAIAERAARAVLKDLQSGGPVTGDLDALKQGFVELKALQSRSDKKTHETLRAVHDALETLVSRLPGEGTGARLAAGRDARLSDSASDAPSADRLEAAVRRLHAAALSQMEEVSSPSAEPPAGGPAQATPDLPRSIGASFSPQEADLGNVRASFIAAARRATQTGTPDRAATAVADELDAPELTIGPVESFEIEREHARAPGSAPSLIARIRRGLESRRRPLLFGLAFLILAAGTAQILQGGGSEQPASLPPVETAAPLASKAEETRKEPEAARKAEAPASLEASSLFQPTSLTAPAPVPPKVAAAPEAAGEIPVQVTGALREAALSGDAMALHEVATRVANGNDLPHDPALAARLYEKAAQAGFAPAQERLAMMHEKGVGVQKDTKLAATWYERAARGGNIQAMHNLGTLLASGTNGKRDYQTAIGWYGEAAEAGLKDSQFNLGVLYAQGNGTRVNLPRAFTWFALAAAQGDDEAAKKRDEIGARLGPVELEAVKAVVQSWQPRVSDPSANGRATWSAGRTAALEPKAAGKS